MLKFFLRKLRSVHLLLFKRTSPLCFRERADTINLQFLQNALTPLCAQGYGMEIPSRPAVKHYDNSTTSNLLMDAAFQKQRTNNIHKFTSNLQDFI